MEIAYRQAEKEDCLGLAEMIDIASSGVVDFLFHDLVPGMTPVQIVAHSLKRDNYPHTFSSAVVAVDGSDVVGMALSYPSSHHEITNSMRDFFPEDRLTHLKHFYAARVENSWYLDALCVAETHRRQGIAEKLITLTKEKALGNGYAAMSLIAFADNSLAIPLYQRTGFEIVQNIELQRNEFIDHEGGCYLMRWDIS